MRPKRKITVSDYLLYSSPPIFPVIQLSINRHSASLSEGTFSSLTGLPSINYVLNGGYSFVLSVLVSKLIIILYIKGASIYLACSPYVHSPSFCFSCSFSSRPSFLILRCVTIFENPKVSVWWSQREPNRGLSSRANPHLNAWNLPPPTWVNSGEIVCSITSEHTGHSSPELSWREGYYMWPRLMRRPAKEGGGGSNSGGETSVFVFIRPMVMAFGGGLDVALLNGILVVSIS